MADPIITAQQLGPFTVYVSDSHRFGTDAFLLAGFSQVKSKETVCDLGSGCGIIPLLLLRGERPPAKVWGLELAADGVALMNRAVEENQLVGRFVPVEGDLRQLPSQLPAGRLDVVTCNPPYFVPGTGYESPDQTRRAARHEHTCTLDEVCFAAARLLKYGGRFCLCHRPERLCDVITALRKVSIEPKRLRFVCQRQGEAPWLLLCEGRLGGNPSLKVEPALVVEHPDGGFSQELLDLYGKTQRLPSKEFLAKRVENLD